MNPRLIVMLTHHDRTVENALAIFESARDLPADCWGFKDVGLEPEKMKELLTAMHQAGKKTFLEVVTYTEQECLAGARLAVETGFDYLMGTLFYESVWAYLKNKPIMYLPFIGQVHGSPSILGGSPASITAEGKKLVSLGIEGFDLLAYRYGGDAEGLAAQVVQQVGVPVVIAGSIDSPSRISKINEINPWGFTIGSALFDRKFAAAGSFKDNLAQVLEIMAGLA